MNNKAIAILGLSLLGAFGSSAASAQNAGEPYQVHRNVYFSTYMSVGLLQFNADAAVPAGKRLIVENVSMRTNLPVGQSAACVLQQNSWPKLFLEKTVAMHSDVPAGNGVESHASFPAKAYIEAGDFRVHCDRKTIAGTGWVNVIITGTLVDAQ